MEALGVGNVHLNMLFKVSISKQAVMYNVLLVPKLACNLFSAAGKGNVIKFGHSRCWIRDQTGKLYVMGSLVDKLYQLDTNLLLKSMHQQYVSRETAWSCGTNVWAI